ncbi:hypothetical protein ACJDU8_17445 [Clostridium sp. WILCCON 0269]|uniref:Uncharacterized protein n=1 Tax=Candidatus Clostridium eludens TaxID=3381663 RepID=A0ABW8SMZ3_9CLOT
MLEIIIPENNAKLDRQIKALQWQIKSDTRAKNKEIHQAAYDRLVEERERRKVAPKIHFGINENSQFMEQLKNLIYNWDLSIMEEPEESREHYLAMWELAQSALKELTGQKFYFSRTDTYFGICNEGEEFLIKKNREVAL